MNEQDKRDIARKILEALYDTWERNTNISLNTAQERSGWEKSIFRTVVDKLENQHGLIKSAGTSYSFEMTPSGVIYAEENGIAPNDRMQWHQKIRQHVPAFLADLYDREGNRAHAHYEKIAKGTPVEDSMKILQDLSLLTKLGYLEAASVTSYRITEEGMRYYRATDYEDII
jgi:hypothetical protein